MSDLNNSTTPEPQSDTTTPVPQNVIVNLQNPIPILLQQKSDIVTNPFIPESQRDEEIEIIQKKANDIIEQKYNENENLPTMSIKSINKNLSKSVIEFIDDCFEKPNDISWVNYIPSIIQKKQRYMYFGIILIFIAIFLLLVQKSN